MCGYQVAESRLSDKSTPSQDFRDESKTELRMVKRLMLRLRGSVMMLHITIIELGPPKSGLAMMSDN
jgi:hypothetical protein